LQIAQNKNNGVQSAHTHTEKKKQPKNAETGVKQSKVFGTVMGDISAVHYKGSNKSLAIGRLLKVCVCHCVGIIIIIIIIIVVIIIIIIITIIIIIIIINNNNDNQ